MFGENKNEEAVGTEMSVDFLGVEDSVGSGSDSGSDGDRDENFFISEDKASRAVEEMICTSGIPPQMIKDQGFLKFCRGLNPLFEFGTVGTVKEKCLEIYNEEKANAMETLQFLDGHISLSLDIMKHPVHRHYICLSAHFIDESWKLKQWVLGFCRYWGTEDYLARAVVKVVLEWGIESKISTITVKTDSECDKMVRLLQDRIAGERRLYLNFQPFQVYCCADIFSTMAKDALDEIPKIIDKVRDLAVLNRESPYWHVTYEVLKEVLELYSKGEFSKEIYRGFIDIPPSDDWKKIEAIVQLLGSIYSAAQVLFESKHPDVSLYLHNLQELRASLIKESLSSDAFIKPIAEKMLQKFDQYWKQMFLLLALKTVMDPRCKMKYFEFSSLKYCNSRDGDKSQVASVFKALQSLYKEYSTEVFDCNESTCDSTSSDSDDEFSDGEGSEGPHHKSGGVEEGCSNSCDNWLQEFHQFIESTDQPVKSDLDFYLEEPVKPWVQDFNVFRWWRSSSPKYPTLSRMARDLLAIPLSVVYSNEAYHTEGRYIDRSLLSYGTRVMEALMCTRSWDILNR